MMNKNSMLFAFLIVFALLAAGTGIIIFAPAIWWIGLILIFSALADSFWVLSVLLKNRD